MHLIANRVNVGFARANNQAFQIARGQFILLLNPDTEIQEYAIVRALEGCKKNPPGLLRKSEDGREKGRNL